MPFKSEAQRRFLYANHPEIAERWEHEHDSKPAKEPATERPIYRPDPIKEASRRRRKALAMLAKVK